MSELRSIFRVVVASLVLALLMSERGSSQETTNPKTPAFDVVSVHSVDRVEIRNGGSILTMMPTKPCRYGAGTVRCQLTASGLVEEAYGLKVHELSAPQWMNGQIFSIQATRPEATAKETARLMLQQALVDRFGLKVHVEDRDTAVYALVAAKQGIRLVPAESDPEHREKRTTDGPMGAMHAGTHFGRGEFFSSAMSLDDFANNMANYVDLDVPILNMTGLTGLYKFDLHWEPTVYTQHQMTMRDPVFTDVVERQLGLRLEKRKATFHVLVVDHMEKVPTEN
jgi:uncharacterized protein (TIGR03435 family)